ncbi:hypothetical protein ACO0OL_002814 [Hanseniaspora opuntiae]
MPFKDFEMAAAGHAGIMTDEGESLFIKPVLKQEFDFYNTIKEETFKENSLLKSDAEDRGVLPINEWIPKYIGSMSKTSNVSKEDLEKLGDLANTPIQPNDTNKSSTSEAQYIVLENLLNGYKTPNVMDIKLGKILYDESASVDKKNRLIKVSSETTSGSLGFRICGMKLTNQCESNYDLFQPSEFCYNNMNTYISVNKTFGRRLKTPAEIRESLKLFFNNHLMGEEYTRSIIKMFNMRLESLIDTLENTKSKFISSSILLIFESNIDRIREHGLDDDLIDTDFDILGYLEEICDEDQAMEIEGEVIDVEDIKRGISLSKLKLVDFGHSVIGKNTNIEVDKNTIDGLKVLKDIFQQLSNEV